MLLTHELLTRVEEESAAAPAALLRQRIALILALPNGADQELRDHAQALLLKLERRLGEECNEPSAMHQPAYLSPGLCLPIEDPVPCRRADPVRWLRRPQRPPEDAAAPLARPPLFAPWRFL